MSIYFEEESEQGSVDMYCARQENIPIIFDDSLESPTWEIEKMLSQLQPKVEEKPKQNEEIVKSPVYHDTEDDSQMFRVIEKVFGQEKQSEEKLFTEENQSDEKVFTQEDQSDEIKYPCGKKTRAKKARERQLLFIRRFYHCESPSQSKKSENTEKTPPIWECPKCFKQYIQKYNLRMHIAKKHKKESERLMAAIVIPPGLHARRGRPKKQKVQKKDTPACNQSSKEGK